MLRVELALQALQTFAVGQLMHPVILHWVQVLLLVALKVYPMMHPEHVLLAEQLLQRVLLQEMQVPFRAENPVMQIPHVLVPLQDTQLLTLLQRTQVLLKLE